MSNQTTIFDRAVDIMAERIEQGMAALEKQYEGGHVAVGNIKLKPGEKRAYWMGLAPEEQQAMYSAFTPEEREEFDKEIGPDMVPGGGGYAPV